MEKETSKKYEAAVAAFIKENKPKGTVVYDDLANQLATRILWMQKLWKN